MVFARANAVQLVVAGSVLVGLGAVLLAFGLNDGHFGTGSCVQSFCSVVSQPLSPEKIIAGVAMMAIGAAALGAGWAYLLGTARPQPTSSPDSQD